MKSEGKSFKVFQNIAFLKNVTLFFCMLQVYHSACKKAMKFEEICHDFKNIDFQWNL